ncbi:MAG TPA: hypothetical protein VK674_00225 [Candidatus Limnocylindria bacterium]|nr:hypothetical protein [Candidatus Limnocylindria bacterium]
MDLMVYAPPKTHLSLDDRLQWYLLLFLRVSVIGGMGLSAYYHEWGAFLYSVLALALMFLPELIKSRARLRLPIEFDVVLVIFMYASVFLGKAGAAYERFWWWDGALHTGAGFILAYIGFLVLYIKVGQKQLQASRLLIGLMIFSVALAFGALWEIYEFGYDILFNGNAQRGSLHDTMWDLIVDGIGALVMARIGIGIIFDKPRGFIARLTKSFVKANPHLGGTDHD